jgi:uncharacterized protein (DUF58 family)
MMVGSLFVSIFIAHHTLTGIRIERQFGQYAIAGEPVDVEYRLRNTKRYWPTMALFLREVNEEIQDAPEAFILHLPSSRAADDIKIAAQMTPRRRGVLRLSTIELSTTFPFGFIRRTKRIRVPQELIVYPRIGMLNRRLAMEYRESVESGSMTSSRRGGHDEFYGIREYRPGDNIRSVHWRSTARTGQLMMRELAANAPPQLILVLNLRTAGARGDSAETLERAIELTAALVCYGYFENFAVGLAIAGLPESLAPVPQMGRDARARLLRQLAVMNPGDIRSDLGVEFPNRIAGRAEWVVVTLHGDDPTGDLLPPGGRAHVSGGGSHRTLLPMDAAESKTWVHFLSQQETLRLLRDRAEGAA